MTHRHGTEGEESHSCPAAEPIDEASHSVIEMVLDATKTAMSPARIEGVLIGHIVSFDVANIPHVTFPHAPPEGLPARAMLPLSQADIGRDVALMFEAGDSQRPIIMGRMATPIASEKPLPLEAEIDDRKVEIKAQEQLVLRCGESSITLTRAGKIIIRGTYVLSRSSGVNRIQGGSVEIN